MKNIVLLNLCILLSYSCSSDLTTFTDGSITSDGGINTSYKCKPGSDQDDDHINDEVEGCDVDTDNDGIPDFADTDSDNDGVPDYAEGVSDSDNDGKRDFQDKDSDNDGIEDGEEDLNGDGFFGCCLTNCGETRDGCPVVAADECGAGQSCQNGTCSPLYEFLCSDGETNPKQSQTYPGKNDVDSPSFICRQPDELNSGLKRIEVGKSVVGNWSIALEMASSYGTLPIKDPTNIEAAGAFDYKDTNANIAGFVVSRPALTQDPIAATSQAIDNFKNVNTFTVSTISSGSMITSHDDFPSVVSAKVNIAYSGSAKVGAIRNSILKVLVGKEIEQLADESFGADGTEFIVSFQVVSRKDREIIFGGVALKSDANDKTKKTPYHLDDLSNGTGVATASDSLTVECDPFVLNHNPVADILWVIDESGSMSNDRKNVVANAKNFFERAVNTNLDFRMAVAGVAAKEPLEFPFIPDPGSAEIVGKLCHILMGSPDNPFDFSDGGDKNEDRFLLPAEADIFKSCIENPPYNEGSS